MNELKPDDVMRGLECCGNQAFCFGSKCPYYGIRRDCLQVLQQDALALLREKDARIEKLEAENREVHRNWQKLKETFDAVTEEDKRILAEKDAEIERLSREVDRLSQVVMYHDGQIADAQADAIDLYIELAKRRLPIVSPSVFDQIAKEVRGV